MLKSLKQLLAALCCLFLLSNVPTAKANDRYRKELAYPNLLELECAWVTETLPGEASDYQLMLMNGNTVLATQTFEDKGSGDWRVNLIYDPRSGLLPNGQHTLTIQSPTDDSQLQIQIITPYYSYGDNTGRASNIKGYVELEVTGVPDNMLGPYWDSLENQEGSEGSEEDGSSYEPLLIYQNGIPMLTDGSVFVGDYGASLEPSWSELRAEFGDQLGKSDPLVFEMTPSRPVKSLTLKKDVVRGIANNGSGLGIRFGNSLQIDYDNTATASIADQAKGDDITFSFSQRLVSQLPQAEQQVLASRTVLGAYSANVSSGGQNITQFGGGLSTLTVPVAPSAMAQANLISAHALRADRDHFLLESLPNHYNRASSIWSMTTDHHSNFVLLYNEPTPTPTPAPETASTPPQTGDSAQPALWMAVMLACAAAFIALYRKPKKA